MYVWPAAPLVLMLVELKSCITDAGEPSVTAAGVAMMLGSSVGRCRIIIIIMLYYMHYLQRIT